LPAAPPASRAQPKIETAPVDPGSIIFCNDSRVLIFTSLEDWSVSNSDLDDPQM
jgi:hypothetical protein